MGGILGALPAVGIMYGLRYLSGRVEATLLPPIDLDVVQVFAILALPFVAALLAMATAHLTTLSALRRLP
jgi:cell division protein FtsX